MTNSEQSGLLVKGATTKSVRIIGGALIGFLCVALGIARVDWRETWAVFDKLDQFYFVSAVALLLTCFIANTERWRHLLDTEQAIPRRRLFGYLMIGYMVNAVLPIRPGDVTRATLLRYRDMVPITTALTSVLLERLLDLLTISLMGFALSFHLQLPSVVITALQILAAGGVAATVTLIIILKKQVGIERLLSSALRWAPARIADFVAARTGQFDQALRVLHRSDRLTRILAANAAGWVALGLSMVAFTHALHMDVPWTAGFLVLVVTSLGSAIPGPPGSVGVFHVLTVLALAVWSVETEVAVAFALIVHTTGIALHVALGAISAVILDVRVFHPAGRSGSLRGAQAEFERQAP